MDLYSLFPELSLHLDLKSLQFLFIVWIKAWKATFITKIWWRETGFVAELFNHVDTERVQIRFSEAYFFRRTSFQTSIPWFFYPQSKTRKALASDQMPKACFIRRLTSQDDLLYSHTICHDKEKAMKFYKDSSVLFWFHGYVAFQVCNYSKSFHSKKSLKLSLAVCLFSFLSRWLLFTQNKLRSHLFSLYGPRINFINRSWHMSWLQTRAVGVEIVLISCYKDIIGKAIDIIKFIFVC